MSDGDSKVVLLSHYRLQLAQYKPGGRVRDLLADEDLELAGEFFGLPVGAFYDITVRDFQRLFDYLAELIEIGVEQLEAALAASDALYILAGEDPDTGDFSRDTLVERLGETLTDAVLRKQLHYVGTHKNPSVAEQPARAGEADAPEQKSPPNENVICLNDGSVFRGKVDFSSAAKLGEVRSEMSDIVMGAVSDYLDVPEKTFYELPVPLFHALTIYTHKTAKASEALHEARGKAVQQLLYFLPQGCRGPDWEETLAKLYGEPIAKAMIDKLFDLYWNVLRHDEAQELITEEAHPDSAGR